MKAAILSVSYGNHFNRCTVLNLSCTKAFFFSHFSEVYIFLVFRNESTDDNTIDLHGLHVTEAIEALERMLAERTGTFISVVYTIRSDEGLMLETSAFESLYGGQFTLTQLIKPIYQF